MLLRLGAVGATRTVEATSAAEGSLLVIVWQCVGTLSVLAYLRHHAAVIAELRLVLAHADILMTHSLFEGGSAIILVLPRSIRSILIRQSLIHKGLASLSQGRLVHGGSGYTAANGLQSGLVLLAHLVLAL